MKHYKIVLLTLIFSLLTACGGGSSSSQTPPPVNTPPPVGTPPPVNDSTPDAFSFTDKPEVPPNQVVESDPVQIVGLGIAAPLSISGGEYSINQQDFTDQASTINNNDSIVVRVTSSSTRSETVSATVLVGSVSDDFSVTTSNDTTAPTVSFRFPSDQSMTLVDAILVSGIASDNGVIANVAINGVEAASSDNFATWTASVPLTLGNNELVATATDLGGNSNLEQVKINLLQQPYLTTVLGIQYNNTSDRLLMLSRPVPTALYEFDVSQASYQLISSNDQPDNQNMFRSPPDFDLDETNNRVLMLDRNFGVDRVLEVDLASGARQVVTTDTEALPHHTLISPNQLELDGNAFAYVLDANLTSGRKAILRFDLATGETKLVSDNTSPGSASARFIWPDSIILDKENSRILLADVFGGRIIAADLETGTRSIFSGTNVPDNNNPLSRPKAIILDQDNNRAIVLGATKLIAVSLDDGARTLLVDSLDIPENFTFANTDMLLDAAGDRVFISSNSSRIYAVDLTSGEQSVFSDDSASIPDDVNPFSAAAGLALDTANNRILVSNRGNGTTTQGAIIAVSLTDGSRSIVSDDSTPNATNSLSSPGGIGVAPNGRIYLVDSQRQAFMRVDADGSRSILSDNSVIDEGNPFGALTAIAVDTQNDRSLVLDTIRKTILSVDNTTGERQVISDQSTPNSDNPLEQPRAMVIQGGKGFVLSQRSFADAAILSVDLVTGERTLLSAKNAPASEVDLRFPSKMILDEPKNRLLVTERENIIAVSIEDGARTILSNDGVPNRQNPFANLADISLDTANQQALVFDQDLNVTFAVDLESGARSLYQGGFPNAQPIIGGANNIIKGTTDNQYIIAAASNQQIAYSGLYKLDATTGLRSTLANRRIPDGMENFPKPTDIYLDEVNQRIIMLTPNSLESVDVNTGVMSSISNNQSPSGESATNFNKASSLAVDSESGIAYVTNDDGRGSLLAVKLNDGTRSLVASLTTADNNVDFTQAVLLDKARNRLLILIESKAIVAVDITSGEQSIFSSNTVPNEDTPIIANYRDMAFDTTPGGNRLFVLDSAFGRVTAVDLLTGVRSFVSDQNLNPSFGLPSATSFVLTDNPNQALVTDEQFGILLLDLLTGEGTIIAR